MFTWCPNQEDPTGHLLHVTGEAMQLKLGYSSKLLAAPLCLQDNMTNLWLKHVWLSMQECEVTLLTNFADTPHLDMAMWNSCGFLYRMGGNNLCCMLSTCAECICRCFYYQILCQEQAIRSSHNSGSQATPQHPLWTGHTLPIWTHMHGLCGTRPSLAHYTWAKTSGLQNPLASGFMKQCKVDGTTTRQQIPFGKHLAITGNAMAAYHNAHNN